MPINLPQYAFSAGEISPEVFGRTDLVKYSVGVRLLRNFTVGLRGGVYSRAGSRMVSESKVGAVDGTLVRFRATGNDYVLEFGDLYMRVIRNGGYILEAVQSITSVTQAIPGVVTAVAHGYATDDWVYVSGVGGMVELNSRYFRVGAVTTNTFELLSPDGTSIDTTGYTSHTSGGSAARVYTLTTTWAAADVKTIRWEQSFNDLTITHLSYPMRRLTYVSDTNWTLADVVIGTTTTAPVAPSLVPSSAGTAGLAFAVTAIVDGSESIASPYELTELSVDYTTTAGSLKVTWAEVPGATTYNIYRSLVLPIGADITLSQEVGYLGTSRSTQFVDNNIIPDFTATPPTAQNPFADGAITQIEVTAGGTGYAKTDTVAIAGGSGFVGYPVISDGVIRSVVLINGGNGYSTPVVSFGTTSGTGATATATAGTIGGNNPRVYRVFQQRGVYAGTMNYPMSLWGSKPGDVDNFDVSSIVNAGDSYNFRLDASVVKPILYLHTIRSGLLIFTSDAVTRLTAPVGQSISATNALAEPQTYRGIGDAKPLSIGLDVVFPERFGMSLDVMEYALYTRSFKLRNLSVLAHHLLGPGKAAQRLEFAQAPDQLIYCLREDGVLLTLTYDKDEQVYGWAQHTTQGYYRDICAVTENGEWVLYLIVEREVGGVWRMFVERVLAREQGLLEGFWCVDAGLEYVHEQPAATLTFDAVTGASVGATASASVFVADDVGKVIYSGGGRATVTAYTSGTQVTCTLTRDITDIVPEELTSIPRPQPEGSWTMARPVSSVDNLWHLEGKTVSVLADGNAYTGLAVSGGSVTWAGPVASKIIVGLPYVCTLQSLATASPQDVLEARRLDVIGLGLRLYKTRGLAVGADFATLVELKDRGHEDWGGAINVRNDSTYVPVNGGWNTDGSIVVQQSYPLPAAVLSLVYSVDKGDT